MNDFGNKDEEAVKDALTRNTDNAKKTEWADETLL